MTAGSSGMLELFSCVCAVILKIIYVGEMDGCLRLRMFQKCCWHADLPKWGS